jgi:hypothetical protein
MYSIRFVGGGMDGKTAQDQNPPLMVKYIAPGSGTQDEYLRSSEDPDGTLVYRKR